VDTSESVVYPPRFKYSHYASDATVDTINKRQVIEILPIFTQTTLSDKIYGWKQWVRNRVIANIREK